MGLFDTLGLDATQAEDSVLYYALYTTDDGAPDAAVLEALSQTCLALVMPYLEGYIWQREAFQLHSSLHTPPPWLPSASPHSRAKGGPAPSASTVEPPCLWGRLEFGDNIEDEWFVVSLLLELSKRLGQLAIKVWDNDGEFLLIEAAYELPRWLKPETSSNRVWLHRGQLHIIPPPSCKQPDLPPLPTLRQALDLLRSGVVDTHAAQAEQLIKQRLGGYPASGAGAMMHRARCLLPRRVAALLLAEPQLVASAVDTFYCRDQLDMRAAAKMAHFPPQDLVPTLVRLNRVLYAQLMQQVFHPPKGYPMPPPSHPDAKAAELGLKLTSGFEMLYARSAKHVAAAAAAAAASAAEAGAPAGAGEAGSSSSGSGAGLDNAASADALHANPAWQAYLRSLDKSNYFQGNLQGSAQHRRLLDAAAATFAKTQLYQASLQKLSHPARRMNEIFEAQPPGRPSDAELAAAGLAGTEDGDGWLEAQAQLLEAELQRRQGEMAAARGGVGAGGGTAFSSASAAAAAASSGFAFERGLGRGGGGASSGKRKAPGAAAAAGGASSSGEDGGSEEEQEEDAEDVEELDAEDLAGKLRRFVEHLSGLDGAELPSDGREVSMDMGKLMAELEGVLGPAVAAAAGGVKGRRVRSDGAAAAAAAGSHDAHDEEESDYGSSSDEGSSFFSDGEATSGSEEEDGMQLAPGPRSKLAGAGTAGAAAQAAWEVRTATDSDDEAAGSLGGDEEAWMEAYDTALRSELRGSTMMQDFEMTPPGSRGAAGTGPSGSSGGAAAKRARSCAAEEGGAAAAAAQAGGAGRGEGSSEEEEEEEELQPVDVDMNLVRNLLRSAGSQQGLPGPATNLAGLLGMQLHGAADARGSSGGQRSRK